MATTNGAIAGVDVDKILRNIEQGRLRTSRLAPRRRRPSASFAGSFTIANGVARTTRTCGS